MIHRLVVSIDVTAGDGVPSPTSDQVAQGVEAILASTLVSSPWHIQSVLPLRPAVAR
jgi:hypothetical protein